MKDISEDKVLSFPGFEKILEPFKITGDARVKKDLVEPEEDEHFSANTDVAEIPEPAGPIDSIDAEKDNKKGKKARKKVQENINILKSNIMKSKKNKFDELFENVMGEEDIAFGMEDEIEAGGDLGGEADEIGGEEHGDIAAKIEGIIDSLKDLHAELTGGEDEDEGEEDVDVDVEGEEEIEDADEHNYDEEGYEDSMEAVSQPEPRALNTNVSNLQNTTANNQVGNVKASGGKADKGSVPAPETGKEHNPAPAVSKLTAVKGSLKQGKGNPGEDLFKV